MAGGGARLGHLEFAPSPGPCLLDRLARPRITRPGFFEVAKDVLGTCRRPKGKQPVIRIGKGAAAPDRDEAAITDGRENHRIAGLVASCAA
jgi:hypothetical protein